MFCDGDDPAAERAVTQLLREGDLAPSARFDAWMLLAEIHYQRSAQEQFLAATDSAAQLLGPSDGPEQEAWSRVEVNRSRYAFFAMQYERAAQLGESAVDRYWRARDRSRWKHAFRIHQALAAAYRINMGSFAVSAPERAALSFAHFDTALALIHARKDLQPYWEASVWRSLSNAAMDHMAPSDPEHLRYAAICAHAQRQALRIMEQQYPGNRLERAMLMNLHGLYLVYNGQPDEAMALFEDTQRLISDDVWREHDDRFYPDLFVALHWKAMVFEREPWRSDTAQLLRYLSELQAAEPLYTRYAAAQATAHGLFTRDRYGYSTFSAIVATCQRLWELTHDPRFIDEALRSTEKARRDAWNSAQTLRRRPDLVLADPPADMVHALRQRMRPDEGLLLCMDYGLGQVGHRVVSLVVTSTDASFKQCDFDYAWSAALDPEEGISATTERRAYHSLYTALYAPAKELLHERVTRLKVISTNELAKLSFDALIADTSSADLRQCHPLVEDHAISYPYFVIPPEGAALDQREGAGLYLAPASGSGTLTDLRILRAAMVRWQHGDLPGRLDSTIADPANALRAMEGADRLLWAGHCGGNIYMTDEPTGYLSASNDDSVALFPSQVLGLRSAPELVIHAACHSGVFHPYGSSGSVSFARAFLFAGARTVMATQHVADERSTVTLLDRLFQELATGTPTDLALQQAKLTYLRQAVSAEEARPLYWATWQLWGDASTSRTPDAPKRGWLWLVGAVAIAASGFALLPKRIGS